MSEAIVAGSVAAVAARAGRSLAEAWLSVDVVLLVDSSGSMAECDSRGGRSRYDVALEELARLQAELPGRLGVFAFSEMCVFVPGGAPPLLHGGTDLARALRFVQEATRAGTRLIVISDGLPNDEREALAAAKLIAAPISTVYTGPESGPGVDFLRRLAAANRGRHVVAARACELADAVRPLLTA